MPRKPLSHSEWTRLCQAAVRARHPATATTPPARRLADVLEQIALVLNIVIPLLTEIRNLLPRVAPAEPGGER